MLTLYIHADCQQSMCKAKIGMDWEVYAAIETTYTHWLAAARKGEANDHLEGNPPQLARRGNEASHAAGATLQVPPVGPGEGPRAAPLLLLLCCSNNTGGAGSFSRNSCLHSVIVRRRKNVTTSRAFSRFVVCAGTAKTNKM